MNSLQRVWNCSYLRISTKVHLYQSITDKVCSAVRYRNIDPLGGRHEYTGGFPHEVSAIDVCWWVHVSNHGLKWSRVARVGDPAPFDLPGLYRDSCLLSCSSKSHKIPLRMHQNSPFSDLKNNSEEGELDLGLRKRPGFFFGPL